MLVAYGDRESPAIIALDDLLMKLDNFEPPMKRASSYIDGRVKANFAGEQSPDGTPWAALSARYARRKAREVGDKPMLQRSGALQSDTHQRGVVNVEGNTTTVKYGTKQPQGTWMQKFPVSITDDEDADAAPIVAIRGPRRKDGPGGRVPPRRFLYLTDGDCDRISELVASHIGVVTGGW